MERKRRSTKELQQKLSDRLSSLPDPILCYILSFLPTKRSVATTILARRWRSLWAHVPTLDFDSESHHSKLSFSGIVNRVLFLHQMRNITTFRLRYVSGLLSWSDYEVESWIMAAIDRKVQNLDLELYSSRTELPRCIFTCKTLVDLRLHKCSGCTADGAVVCLPSLKKLLLDALFFETDEFLPQLLSGCPVLEELAIRVWEDQYQCLISSPTVKRLTITYITGCSNVFERENTKFEINTPSLRYLKFFDCRPQHVSIQALNSLIEADIEFYTEIKAGHNSTVSLLNFVYTLCSVKHLKLSVGEIQFSNRAFTDSRFGSSTTGFDNLTKLELDADWSFVRKLLEKADNLEILTIEELWYNSGRYWKKPRQVPTCLISHLTTVIISNFMATKEEFKIVKYFLKNSRDLKRMKICHDPDENQEGKCSARERILQFPRGSGACQLEFV